MNRFQAKMNEPVIKLGRIMVYSIVGCPHCLRAKNTLAKMGLQYTDVSIDNYKSEVRDELKRLTGGKTTVPQIFFNDVHIGGNEELQSMITQNAAEFKRLVQMLETTAPSESAPQVPGEEMLSEEGKKTHEFICEPDEYAILVHQMKSAGVVRNSSKMFGGGKQSFKGSDMIDWLVREKQISSERAVEIGQALIDGHFGKGTAGEYVFDVDKYYRLLEDDDSSALNAGALSECQPLPASELGETIRLLILALYSKHISPDGATVDYVAIKQDADFKSYVDMTKQLQRVDVLNSDRQEKLAFFINVYNALVIHGTVVKGVPANMWQRWKFFNTVSYIIGGQTYNLQHIENGVLRSNRKGVGMFSKPFNRDDPRLKVALEDAEPKIHFALNCGAKSCPPIKTFSAKGVDDELKAATEAFLESDDGLKLDTEKNTVHLSQIFKWYKQDFGGSDEKVVEWVAGNLGEGKRKMQLLKIQSSSKQRVQYMPYDWGHNSK